MAPTLFGTWAMLGRIAGRLRWHNITVAPLVALATTVVVSVLSIHGLVTGGRAAIGVAVGRFGA